MFGYVQPLTCELRVRDKSMYDAYYCGLCSVLKKEYGIASQALLSYDCAFIAILLSAPNEQQPVLPHKCVYKGFKKKPIVAESAALDFAAALNVLLSWHKLRDSRRDERKLLAGAVSVVMRASYKKARALYPNTAASIEAGIEELTQIERENAPDIDPPADAFARMMRACLANAPVSNNDKLIMGEIAYHLGRWIYLADAWDDKEKDKKSGSFNPFINADATVERVSFLLYLSLNEAAKAYDLLNVNCCKPILDNIIRLGCYNRTEKLLKEADDKPRRF